MKRVTVVLLNWNGWRDTLGCIASLQKQDYPNFDLIVVDNGSTDGSQERILGHQPAVELVQTGANLGFGGGCNVGIRLALERGADYVWLVNSDATVDVQALSALVRAADRNPVTGLIGSVILEAGTVDEVQLWGGGVVNLWLGRSHHRKSDGPLDFVSGASLFLRRRAIEDVGLFDHETFFMYWEDTDLAFRMRKAGWQLAVATDSKIWHKESASLGKNSPKLDQYFTQSAVRFFRRHGPSPRVTIALLMGSMLLKRILIGDVERVRAVLKGYLAA